MADLRLVSIVWKDEPKRPISTWVMVGKKWTEENDEGKVFEYFSSEEEYESAKNKDNNKLDYWIIDNTTTNDNGENGE